MPDLFFNNVINYTHCKIIHCAGGSASIDQSIITLSTSSTPKSSCILEGALPIYVNQEEHSFLQVNSAFSAPPTTGRSQQLTGMGDSEAGVFFGYDSDRFGILVKRGGHRQCWKLVMLSGSSGSGGVITLTLADTVVTIPVPPGLTPMELMGYMCTVQVIRDANMRACADIDHMIIYMEESQDCSACTTLASIDCSSGAGNGTLSSVRTGAPAQDIWIYRENFNELSASAVQDVVLTDMNLFGIKFSKFSSGNIQFFIYSSASGDMTLVHTWTPPDVLGFNTSRAYLPCISVKNSSTCSTAMHLMTSMASISSGTPSPGAMTTSFSATLPIKSLTLTADKETVVGMFCNPYIQDGARNTLTACLTQIRAVVDSPRPVRLNIWLNSILDAVVPSMRYLPWSCINLGIPSPAHPVQMHGRGFLYSTIYISNQVPEQVRDFTALYNVPGTTLVLTLTSVDEPVTVQTMYLDMEWDER